MLETFKIKNRRKRSYNDELKYPHPHKHRCSLFSLISSTIVVAQLATVPDTTTTTTIKTEASGQHLKSHP